MKEQKTTVVIVKGKGNTFLGVSRKTDHNSWGFGGGKCDDGEAAYECAARELTEETGLVATSLKFMDVRAYVNKTVEPPTLDTVFCYLVDKYDGELLSNEELLARGEAPIKWVTPEELKAGVFGDYNEKILAEYYNL